jgi:hypothetical protein
MHTLVLVLESSTVELFELLGPPAKLVISVCTVHSVYVYTKPALARQLPVLEQRNVLNV